MAIRVRDADDPDSRPHDNIMRIQTLNTRKMLGFRFTLRTLLLGMVIFGVMLGWKVQSVHRQRAAVDQITRAHGSVGYRHEGPFIDSPHGIDGPKLPAPAPRWLIQAAGIDYFDRVESVNLATRAASLDAVEQLPYLRKLDLNSALGLRDIARLKPLSRLEWLVLSGTDVADLAPLQEMSQLKVLYLQSTRVTDIRPLRKLVQLRGLDLGGTAIRDFSPLRNMTELQVLSLYETSFRNTAVLSDLHSLSWLDLRGTQIEDLSPLVGLKRVRIAIDKDWPFEVPAQLISQVRRL